MAFCPVCQAEYRPGFTHCSDCKVELVEFLEQESTELDKERTKRLANLQWVYLQSTYDDFEADIIAGLLKSNDIPTLRKYPGHSGYAKIYLGFAFGVELYVPKEQLEEAKNLIIQVRQEAKESEI